MYMYGTVQLRTDGEDSHKQENISVLDLFIDRNSVVSKCFQSLNNSSQKSHSKTAVFSRVKISKNIFSHTGTLPTCPEKFDLGKYVTSTRQRWLSLICPHNFPPLMYDWYTLHCCVTCPIIRYVIDRQVCHSLHSSFSCKNLSCVVSLLVLAKGIVRNGATLINILYKYKGQIILKRAGRVVTPERNFWSSWKREMVWLSCEIRRHIVLLKTYLLHRCITLNLYHI